MNSLSFDTRGMTWADFQSRMNEQKTQLFRKYTLKMDTKSIKRVMTALSDTLKVFTAIDNDIKALPALDPEQHGKIKIAERAKLLEEYEKTKAEAVEKARAIIKEAQADFKANLDKQTVITPEMISADNAASFSLLNSGLLSTPEQLYATSELLRDNPAMRKACTQYAERMARENPTQKAEWDSCSFIDAEKSLREFSDKWFNQMYGGAENPEYYGMLAETEGSLRDTMDGYGIISEFSAGEASESSGE